MLAIYTPVSVGVKGLQRTTIIFRAFGLEPLLVITTICLAILNWRVLKKYDHQRKIDIFYHSYPYRKELRDSILEIKRKHFSSNWSENNIPGLPWNYPSKNNSISQLQNMPDAKNYKEILHELRDVYLAFPDQKSSVEKSIKLLEAFDHTIREYLWKENDEERRKNLVNAYNAVKQDQLSVQELENELNFPREL